MNPPRNRLTALLWPHEYSTPLWSLRYRLNRCQVGPWTCWRKATVDDPAPACHNHLNVMTMRLMRTARRAYKEDPVVRARIDAAIAEPLPDRRHSIWWRIGHPS